MENLTLPPRFDVSPEILKARDSLCSLFDLCLLVHPGSFNFYEFFDVKLWQACKVNFWTLGKEEVQDLPVPSDMPRMVVPECFASLFHGDAVSFVKAGRFDVVAF